MIGILLPVHIDSGSAFQEALVLQVKYSETRNLYNVFLFCIEMKNKYNLPTHTCPIDLFINRGHREAIAANSLYLSSRKSTTFFILMPSYEFTKLLSMDKTTFS